MVGPSCTGHAAARRVQVRERGHSASRARKWLMHSAQLTWFHRDGFTVAGLMRRLARSRSDHEMLVVGRGPAHVVGGVPVGLSGSPGVPRDGLVAGDRVALLDRNGLPYFDVLFGGALLGAVNVAVNWRLAPAEMAAIIDDDAASILVVHADYLPALAQMASALPAGAPHRRAGRPRRDRDRVPTPGPSPMTSGSTGAPRRTRAMWGTRGGQHAALHLGDHGTPQGGHADQRQPGDGGVRSGAHLRHHRRHGQPGGHAALPHRRFRLGALRHVAGRSVVILRDVDPAGCSSSSRPSASPRCSWCRPC